MSNNLRMTTRNEIFSQSAQSEVVFSRNDLSSSSVGSWRMGVLYPIYMREDITPGDKFDLRALPNLQFLPLVSPAITAVNVDIRYFFVPNRLLWSKWKNFITPSTSEDLKLVEPFINNFSNYNGSTLWFNVAGSIFDYMGRACIPWSRIYQEGEGEMYGLQRYVAEGSGVVETMHDQFGFGSPAKIISFGPNGFVPQGAPPIRIPLYPYLAYNMIWNEYYRDENLQDLVIQSIDDAGDQGNIHHMFHLRYVNWEKDYFSSSLPWVTQNIYSVPTVQDGMTVEQLREASALTRWLELQAIGGHRYQESILTHFGVHVPDEAAQIPVYLGGLSTPVNINQVEQTSSTNEVSPLATLAGNGRAADNGYIDKIEFKEHGVLLGVMCIRPQALYADVTPRDQIYKDSRHDYLWPSFVNLGDEAVLLEEINPGYSMVPAGNGTDFGYQLRYMSYRTAFDQVHGELRPGEPLESWTQARSWLDTSAPDSYDHVYRNIVPITKDFITCQPSNRIFAVTTKRDNIIGTVTTVVDAVRPLPNHVDPKLD